MAVFQDLTELTTASGTNEVLLDNGITTGRITVDNLNKVIQENWSKPQGGYLFDGVDDYVAIPDSIHTRFDTFSLYFWLKTTLANQYVFSKGSASSNQCLVTVTNTNISFTLTIDGTSILSFSAAVNITDNNYHFVSFTSDRVSANIYVDGKPVTTTITTITTTQDSLNYDLWIGRLRNTTNYYKYNVAIFIIFNRVLTANEVLNCYKSGVTHYLPFADIGGNNTALTSGTLIIGKRYKIDSYVTGDDFSNIATVESGTINTSGCIFICEATTPTVWTNGSSLRQIGCVAKYLPENAGRIGWVDTMNGLHGSTSGSPICLNTEQRPLVYRDVKLAIANTATALTNIVPKGYRISTIRAISTASLSSVIIGTSLGGNQIVISTTVTTTAELLALAGNVYDEANSTTLYAQHGTAGQTMNLIFVFEKINN